MIPAANVAISEEEFRRIASQMFPEADNETLTQLYPMVNDLRELARIISEIVLTDAPLSETATGS